MAKISVSGLDQYVNKLGILQKQAHEINRGALGEGAGYAADEIRSAVAGMPTMTEETRKYGEHRLYGATDNELAQILNNLGIKRFSENGGKISTQIGFGGYVYTPSKKFGNRIPTGMLVQCINYGTRFRQGTHTLDKVTNAIKKDVSDKIQKYIDKEVEKIMK